MMLIGVNCTCEPSLPNVRLVYGLPQQRTQGTDGGKSQ